MCVQGRQLLRSDFMIARRVAYAVVRCRCHLRNKPPRRCGCTLRMSRERGWREAASSRQEWHQQGSHSVIFPMNLIIVLQCNPRSGGLSTPRRAREETSRNGASSSVVLSRNCLGDRVTEHDFFSPRGRDLPLRGHFFDTHRDVGLPHGPRNQRKRHGRGKQGRGLRVLWSVNGAAWWWRLRDFRGLLWWCRGHFF